MNRIYRLVPFAGLLILVLATVAALEHDNQQARLGNYHPNDNGYFVVVIIGFAITLGSLLWVFQNLWKEEKARVAVEQAKQREREADPEWAEYQRLDEKFFGEET